MTAFKGAIVGDQHFSDVAPSSRSDDYKIAILEKMRFILEYCREKKIPHVFLLGDMFHRKQPNHNSHLLVHTLISLFKEYIELGVTTYSLVGNHDFTTDISLLSKQPIMTVFKSGAVKTIGLGGKPHIFDCGSFRVEVNGVEYSDRDNGTEKSAEAYNLEYSLEESVKIALFHSTLLPDGKSFFGDWLNFVDVEKHCRAEFIACGHFHPGYEPPVLQAHNKTWCNPGAISRGTAEDHNLTRLIRFVTFLHDGLKLYTKVVEIPHESGDKVFDVKKLEKQKEERRQHAEFVDALEDPDTLKLDVSTVDHLCRVSEKLSDNQVAVNIVKRLLVAASDSLES